MTLKCTSNIFSDEMVWFHKLSLQLWKFEFKQHTSAFLILKNVKQINVLKKKSILISIIDLLYGVTFFFLPVVNISHTSNYF